MSLKSLHHSEHDNSAFGSNTEKTNSGSKPLTFAHKWKTLKIWFTIRKKKEMRQRFS